MFDPSFRNNFRHDGVINHHQTVEQLYEKEIEKKVRKAFIRFHQKKLKR